MTRDRRNRIFRSVLLSKALTPAQKLFLFAAITLKGEVVDGKRRYGSKAMGPDGTFSLHLDYLAKALDTSADNVKYMRRGCQQAGYLSEVHRGTHGRPSAYQALVVRGKESYGVTVREILTPYGSLTPVTRGEESAPLTYKTPDEGEQAPNSGVEPDEVQEGQAQRRGSGCADPDVSRLTSCAWHPHSSCPSDCANSGSAGRSA
jgi:hypothetical protein